MRARVFAGCAIVAIGLSVAAYAAPAEPAGESNAGGAPTGDASITFEQYRAWRLAAMERRRSEIDMQLAAADLSPTRKTRLEETRAYYKWLADMPEAERDQRFRERFERIDSQSRRRHRHRRARRLARASSAPFTAARAKADHASRRARRSRTVKRMRPSHRQRSAGVRQISLASAGRILPFAVFSPQKQRGPARGHAILSRITVGGTRGLPTWRKFSDWTPRGVIPAIERLRQAIAASGLDHDPAAAAAPLAAG